MAETFRMSIQALNIPTTCEELLQKQNMILEKKESVKDTCVFGRVKTEALFLGTSVLPK